MLIYREAIKKRRCLHLDSSLSFNTYITIWGMKLNLFGISQFWKDSV